MKIYNYEEIEQHLADCHAFTQPAEAQGIMCGLICAGSSQGNTLWQESVIGDGNGDPEALEKLQAFFDQICVSLNGNDLDLHILLPDSSLSARSQALAKWCQGFLTGLALSGAANGNSDEAKEIIKDFTEIAKIDSQNATGTDEEEQFFMEISEHVRVSVLLMHSVLNSSKHQQKH